MLMSASTTQAQISTAPRRHRTTLDNNKSSEFGRKQRQDHNGQQQQHELNEKNVRKLEDDVESDLDMSMPSGPSVRMMSIPLQELRLDLSIPLKEMRLDFSMPAAETDEANFETTTLGNAGSDDSTPLLASFLAGISVLIVASVALFAKIKQNQSRRSREVEASQSGQEIEDWERREDTHSPKGAVVSDMQGQIEGDMQDVNIV